MWIPQSRNMFLFINEQVTHVNDYCPPNYDKKKKITPFIIYFKQRYENSRS